MSAKLSAKTTKYYCGRKMGPCINRCCDGNCGPTSGCNCLSCMKLDIKKYNLPSGTLMNRQGVKSKKSQKTGKFYCGRKNMQGVKGCNGYCGPNDGPNCKSCKILDDETRPGGRYFAIMTDCTSIGTLKKDIVKAFCYETKLEMKLLARERAEKCEDELKAFAASSAAGNLIPFAGVAIDIGIIVAMSNRFAEIFGLDTMVEDLQKRVIKKATNSLARIVGQKIVQKTGLDVAAKTAAKEAWKPIQKKLVEYVGKSFLLKVAGKHAGTQATKSAFWFIPGVGSVVGASLGAAMTYHTGQDLIQMYKDLMLDGTNKVLDDPKFQQGIVDMYKW